ncbi:MAG: hypothetical protein U1F56_07880 [Rubrivivax sp.]
MSPDARLILERLQQVAAERARQAQDPVLARRVQALKAFQHRRFERTYADLLADPATRAAALFFLTDLYGARDFSDRDAQFARIVPGLDRLFPAEVVHTVCELSELHALSEAMDHRMADLLAADTPDPAAYMDAWCRAGQPDRRERQVALMLAVGGALVGYTRNRWLRRSLHLMRGPARLAGLTALHGFLERGFDTFADLRDPQAFLDTVARRERALAARLFTRPSTPPPDLPAPGDVAR